MQSSGVGAPITAGLTYPDPVANPSSGAGTRVGLFVALSTVAGVLVAGLALPAVGLVGLTAKRTSENFQSLPASLSVPPLKQRSRLLAADGTVIATFYSQNRVYVPMDKIAPVMQDAIVAIEDARFYEHNGIDVRGTFRALIANTQAGEVTQGGSTITQQYVKNVLAATATTKAEREAATEDSIGRKIRELRYALGLEERWSKRRILEGYLNIAYYGSQAYGIEVASQRYFSIPASELNPGQAATLAGIVKYPSLYDPLVNPDESEERRDFVLQRMADENMISQKQADKYQKRPLEEDAGPQRPHPRVCRVAGAVLLHVRRGVVPVRPRVRRHTRRPASAAQRWWTDHQDHARHGRPTLRPGCRRDLPADRRPQRARRSHRHDGARNRERRRHGAEPQVRQGARRQLHQQRGRRRSTQGPPASSPDRPSRSSPSPLPSSRGCRWTTSSTRPRPVSGRTAPTRTVRARRSVNGAWATTKAARSGNFTMYEGTAYSINTYFAELARRTGLCNVWDVASRAGVTTANTGEAPVDDTELQYAPGVIGGTFGMSPLTLAESYATFAARGLHCEPRVITAVRTLDKQQVEVPEPDCEQVIKPEVADAVNDVMVSVIDGRVPSPTGAAMDIGRPAAGKTGTTDDYNAVWFAGYTPDLAAAVWAGHPDAPKQYPMRDVTINGTYYSYVFGSSLPGPIWRDAMLGALADVPFSTFTPLNPELIDGATLGLPSLAGLTPQEAVRRLDALDLVSEVSDGEVGVLPAAGNRGLHLSGRWDERAAR